MKKRFYNFICSLLSFYNRFYFQKLRVLGRENIPIDGAILFSPNHQNALIDPLLVGTTCKRSVHSLTRSDVFGGPWQWLLDAMQTLPVYRIRDGYEKLKRNQEVFENCYTLLGNKNNLMMFSEGKHHDQYYLQPLSKGSSRLAMEAQLRSPEHTIYLQAVGLNYGSYLHARHDCVIVYGKAIAVSNFVADYQKHPAKGLNAMRDALQVAMEECLWLPHNNDIYSEQKKFINRQNTGLPFKELKGKLKKKDSNLAIAPEKSLLDAVLINLFSLPNISVHLGLYLMRKQFDDHVFHGTINYLGGLILFPLWWGLGLFFITYNYSIYWSLSIFACCIISLFFRQNLIVKNL